MTPPIRFRNLVLGTDIPSFGDIDASDSLERLSRVSEVSRLQRQAAILERDEAASQLVIQGHGSHGEAILRTFREVDLGRLTELQEGVIREARNGDRASYFQALQLSYVLLHHSLGNADGRAAAPEQIRTFTTLTREYARSLRENAELSAADRFRFLFAASRIARTMLGRLNADEGDIPDRDTLRQSLTSLLVTVYDQLLSHHGALVAAEPGGEHFTGIFRQIQMRRAVLAGDMEEAERRALETASCYESNPPPGEDSAHAERSRWDHVAARELLRDGEFIRLVGEMEVPTSAEESAAILNGVAYELLQVVAATIDMVNEDPEEEIRSRYTALAAAVSTLSLTRPGMSLREILETLQNPDHAEALMHEFEGAGRTYESIQQLLNQVRGESSLTQWTQRVQAAARHVLELSEGPGSSLMGPILEQNRERNAIARLSGLLSDFPDLAASLGFRPNPEPLLSPNQQLAIELLRRGPVALDQLRHYASAHPDRDLSDVAAILEGNHDPERSVNEMAEELMNRFETDLDGQDDHVVSAVHAIFQVLSQTETIAEGVEFSSALRTRSRHNVEEIQGFWFRAGRVWQHLSSATSIATLMGGAVFAEILPAVLISRAGIEGRYALAGLELVNAGRLTAAGATVTGLGTGLAISTISTGLHTMERDRMGLRTHFGRDFALSAAINTVAFGATVPFSRWWSRALSPATEDAAAIGRLTGWRRFSQHAGTAMFGTALGWGLGVGMRGATTGEWTTSWDEIAENFLSMLAWELGAAGIRRVRQRIGLGRELAGRPMTELVLPPEALEVPLTSGQARRIRESGGVTREPPGRIARARHRLARGITGLGDMIFTHLGRHRTQRVQEISDRIVTEMIEFSERNRLPNQDPVPIPDTPEGVRRHRFWGFVARQVALQEIVAPGSLERYHDAFFAQYHPMIAGGEGSYRLVFLPSGNMRPVFDGVYMPPPPRGGAPEGGPNPPAGGGRPGPREARPAETRREAAPPVAAAPPTVRRGTGWNQDTLEAARAHPEFASRLEFLRQQLLIWIAPEGARRVVEVPVEFYPDTMVFTVPPRETRSRIYPGSRETMVGLPSNFDTHDMALRLPALEGSRGVVELNLQTGEYRILPAPPPPPPRDRHAVREMPAVRPEELGLPPPAPPRPRHDAIEMPMMRIGDAPPEGETTVSAVRHTQVGIAPRLEILPPGSRRTAIHPNLPNIPRQAQDFFATSQGEVFAFTEIGFDKSETRNPQQRLGVGINEDAYGVGVDPNGRTILMVADGMGGHGNGDRASARAIESVLDVAQIGIGSLGRAFLSAHQAIVQDRHGGATCATACRINPDGTVEVGQAGDTMVYVLRPSPDGTHRIMRAFLPGNNAGSVRGMGDNPNLQPAFRISNTIAMNASDLAHGVTGGLGGRSREPQITSTLHNGVPNDIYEGLLTIPVEGTSTRETLRLRRGDGLLLVSDGLGDIFDSQQLGETTAGHDLTQAMGEAIYAETLGRLDLFVRSLGIPRGTRIRINQGSFTGMYLENGGEVYDAPTGGRHVGHIHGDNVTGLLFRYTGASRSGT